MSKDFGHDPNIFLLGNIHSWILLFLGNKIPLILLLGGPSLFLNQREKERVWEREPLSYGINFLWWFRTTEWEKLYNSIFNNLGLCWWKLLYYMFCDSPPALSPPANRGCCVLPCSHPAPFRGPAPSVCEGLDEISPLVLGILPAPGVAVMKFPSCAGKDWSVKSVTTWRRPEYLKFTSKTMASVYGASAVGPLASISLWLLIISSGDSRVTVLVFATGPRSDWLVPLCAPC